MFFLIVNLLSKKKRRDSPHRELIEFIQERVPELDIPWLVSGREAGDVKMLKEEAEKRKGQENEESKSNKDHREDMEVARQEEACELKLPPKLQPLKIKQVTAKRPRLENK